MTTAVQSIHTRFGPATIQGSGSGQTLIHTIANWMWLPTLVMGGMAIAVSIGLGIAQADAANDLRSGFSAARQADFETLKPLTAGTLFLGEALVLSGISFLLATILGALRKGGGEVQESVGAPVKTLKMPWSAWTFLGLMMMGVVAEAVAFGSLIYVATQAHDAWIGATAAGVPGSVAAFNEAVTWATWANPLREVALGLLLAGIGFALYTISNVLGFQFSRISELITGQDEGGN
jgi:hypothetical protein